MDVAEHEFSGLRLRRRVIAAAGLAGLLGVVIGAFGAHLLEGYLSDQFSLPPELLAKRIDQFDVGARYHLVHAAAMLALAVLPLSTAVIRIAGSLMLAGIVLFSGSLYLLVATNTPWLGAVTPFGGASWIIAWGVIAAGAMSRTTDGCCHTRR
jgi:uncharacterized membrane protein YgdD (TMEM256/DUF423 family)